ncbi:hypothetical protein ACIQUM_07270 [Amycolatopsis azurea]|uniref:hypothetical protein n=1 Tax=Amycolatopsis azurea TaxID=36819 RepID=UPI003809A1FF
MNDNPADLTASPPPREVPVLVSRSSRVGQSEDPINTVTRHLPSPDAPYQCAVCCDSREWPCSPSDTALHQLENAGLRRSDFVPDYLHDRLPRPSTRPPASPSWPGETP